MTQDHPRMTNFSTNKSTPCLKIHTFAFVLLQCTTGKMFIRHLFRNIGLKGFNERPVDLSLSAFVCSAITQDHSFIKQEIRMRFQNSLQAHLGHVTVADVKPSRAGRFLVYIRFPFTTSGPHLIHDLQQLCQTFELCFEKRRRCCWNPAVGCVMTAVQAARMLDNPKQGIEDFAFAVRCKLK